VDLRRGYTRHMERLGRYVLLEKLAEGGMAEVFRGAGIGSAGFAKTLAIKRILPASAKDPYFVSMLIDEAKLASQLSHPNIVQVVDLGHVDAPASSMPRAPGMDPDPPIYYLVMEFVAGQSLSGVLRTSARARKRLPHPFAVAITIQVLGALEYAHTKRDVTGRPLGIIHRDVSPQNILLSYDGQVKLADFGIAKATAKSTNTVTGSVKGKPGYMAPEQMSDMHVDHRLDVYAMGVVLHEMLTMRRMRQADSDAKVLLQVAQGEFPRFEALGIDVPPALAQVVYRALEPVPDARFPSAHAFLEALQKAMYTLDWSWTPNDTRKLLEDLFPTELEREQSAQESYATLIRKLSEAKGEADVAEAEKSLDGATPLPPPPGLLKARTSIPPVGAELEPTRLGNDTPAPARPGSVARVGALGAVVTALLGGALWWNGNRAATLSVDSEPPGAQVVWRGTALGNTPLSVPAAPGKGELVLELAGHVPGTRALTLEPGATVAVSLVLAPATRAVTVHSVPEGAAITLDGQPAGKSPAVVRLEKRTHVIQAVLAGHQDARMELPADFSGDTAHLTLTPEPRNTVSNTEKPRRDPPRSGRHPARGGEGFLTLTSKPWAKVVVDGKDMQVFTPVSRLPLSAGSHTVTLSNPKENLSITFKVTIQDGAEVTLSKSLLH
jgi:serine/threonine protein kinase